MNDKDMFMIIEITEVSSNNDLQPKLEHQV